MEMRALINKNTFEGGGGGGLIGRRAVNRVITVHSKTEMS